MTESAWMFGIYWPCSRRSRPLYASGVAMATGKNVMAVLMQL